MILDRTRAVVLRILHQLRRDRRTLAMVFVLPPLLLWLMEQIYANTPGVSDRVGTLMLGLFPFLVMFLITSIAVLRERTQGTLDRLMASPIGRGDLMGGYAIAYTLVAIVQGTVTMTVGFWLLGLPNEGSVWLAFMVIVGQAVLGVALGLFLSAFAQNEFQAVQFLPAVVLPQFLLAGLLVPLERLPGWLETVARVMPLTYALEALGLIMRSGRGIDDAQVAVDLAVIVGFGLVLLVGGSLTLQRSEA